MFYNRKLLWAIGASIAISTANPATTDSPPPYDYTIVNKADQLMETAQQQITGIRVCLESITPIIKKNNRYQGEELTKIALHLQKIYDVLEGFEKRKFADTDTAIWVQTLCNFNEAVIDHISEIVRTNFKNIDSYDINDIITKALGTKSASFTVENIEAQLLKNSKKLAQLDKKAQGLSWYNHAFRALDNWVITPCQKYSIPQRAALAAGLLLAVEVPWWEYFRESHQTAHRFIPNNWYNSLFGEHPQIVAGVPVYADNLGGFGKAKCAYTHWVNNLSLSRGVIIAVSGLALWEAKALYPKIQKQLNILKNKLKGGVYHQEAERAANIVDPVRFRDIFGQDEIKRYLQHLVDYLENPESADHLGLTPPKGILFIGDTRTGKTHMVNALQNEINDMFKRKGLSGENKLTKADAFTIQRLGIENILNQAKNNAPCIVFIDEIDLLFLQRAGVNNVLSEFLQAMGDAVNSKDSKKQVIIIAATNRPETLDVALRQPGRFGKELRFEYPNYQDRLTFLRNKLSELSFNTGGLDVEKLAKYTENKSYESLNMLIKNAIIKARLRGALLNQTILDESLDEDVYHIIPNYTKNIPQYELDILAAHFAGQALALHLLDNSVQLAKVTIKQVMTELKEEFAWAHLAMNSNDKKEQQQRFEYGKIFTCHGHDSINMNSRATKLKLCKMYLAGFVAEELLLGSCSYSCHAESDKQNALAIAQSISLEGHDSKTMPKPIMQERYNQALAIMKQCEQEIRELLEQNIDSLKRLSAALLEHKTLDRDQVATVLNPTPATSEETIKDDSQKQ